MIKLLKFIVHKENEDLDVLLLRHKNTDKWSFVNLTKGHICKCAFDDISAAVEDMEQQKQDGRIIDYFEIVSGK